MVPESLETFIAVRLFWPTENVWSSPNTDHPQSNDYVFPLASENGLLDVRLEMCLSMGTVRQKSCSDGSRPKQTCGYLLILLYDLAGFDGKSCFYDLEFRAKELPSLSSKRCLLH